MLFLLSIAGEGGQAHPGAGLWLVAPGEDSDFLFLASPARRGAPPPAFSRAPNRDTIDPTQDSGHDSAGAQRRVHHNNPRPKEVMMAGRFSTSMVTVAIAAAALSTAISVLASRTSAQAPASNTALKTSWGEPDLQGI